MSKNQSFRKISTPIWWVLATSGAWKSWPRRPTSRHQQALSSHPSNSGKERLIGIPQFKHLPACKLTWQEKMDLLKMYSLLKMVIFQPPMLVYQSAIVLVVTGIFQQLQLSSQLKCSDDSENMGSPQSSGRQLRKMIHICIRKQNRNHKWRNIPKLSSVWRRSQKSNPSIFVGK